MPPDSPPSRPLPLQRWSAFRSLLLFWSPCAASRNPCPCPGSGWVYPSHFPSPTRCLPLPGLRWSHFPRPILFPKTILYWGSHPLSIHTRCPAGLPWKPSLPSPHQWSLRHHRLPRRRVHCNMYRFQNPHSRCLCLRHRPHLDRRPVFRR